MLSLERCCGCFRDMRFNLKDLTQNYKKPTGYPSVFTQIGSYPVLVTGTFVGGVFLFFCLAAEGSGDFDADLPEELSRGWIEGEGRHNVGDDCLFIILSGLESLAVVFTRLDLYRLENYLLRRVADVVCVHV